METALKEYSAAAREVPDNLEILYWNAVTLATNGHVERAIPLFKEVFAASENWAELLRRLPKAGLMSIGLVHRVLKEAGR